jgi:CheY-like chemotaxis protein
MASQVSPPDTSHRTTVLLIDDDKEDRKYWSDALRNSTFHYSVLEAETGEAGLHLYRHQPIDCVVLDLDMPESGFLTLIQLIPDCERPQVPVVIFTKLMQPTLLELVKKYGAYACLVKQHSSTEVLANAIQQAIGSVKSIQEGHA